MEVPWWSALCVALLCSAFVPSQAGTSCKNTCKGDGGPFEVGKVYKYQLEGSTVTNLPGSPNEVSSLAVSAVAEVFAETKCQHVLKLSNVVVTTADGQKHDGLSADCAKPIKFSYNEGKLAELCGEADDRGAALNIKRAVISLLSSLKKKDSGSETGYENDVFGICPTDFTFTKDGTKLNIHKTKNLNRCALREDFNFPFPTTPYQAVQSSYGAFETSPLLGAELIVDQVIDNGVLQKATGEEHYTYRPLVSPDAGASVKVSYTLTLAGSSAGTIPANVNSPKGVYYETAHDSDGIKNHDEITKALQKATSTLEPVASQDAAKEFANLVYAIEQGSKADILQAYAAAQGKTAKNLFLDGLLYAGSADSIEAAAELLATKQIPEESAVRWYLDLNFVKHVSRGSLTSLLPLLNDKIPHQAYLGVGAVAGKFCIEHPQLCETSPEFKNVLNKLAAPLAGGCKAGSHDKENTIIASLKGLRNTRHLTDEVAQKISQCASDKAAKTRVRVAAIEAFHADASKPVLKQAATSILKDVEEDSELRIKAYLALVECPCPKTADTIKEIVDNEPVNQVGSFVVSHLRNLRASVSPEKEAAKQFFGNIIPKKKFPIDQRKFSRNYEVSYSLDALNVGAVGEVNRIFSQKSFIPRSVSLNLTTQIFGHSVNLAEIGLRAENLEWHFEKYFGPKGLFKTKGVKILDEAYDHAEQSLKKAKAELEAHRPKRSVTKQQAGDATSKVQLGPDYEDHHTDLDLSVKLFGSDIAWVNYHHDKLDYEGLKKRLYGKMDESFDKSKNIDIDYKKARQFLDAGVTYPTGLGFGLKVKVQGNSAVNIKVNGNIDLKAIASHPQNAHVAFQVVPSGSVELASVISVDADVVEAGVKVSANLHSSTGSDLTVKVLDGYGVDVKFGLPVKKQEILNFHSDVVSIVREKKNAQVESPIKFNVKRQEHGGCFDQLSTLTGLTFCGEVSIPMEGFKVLSPAYGPSKASIRLEKDDESLTAYHFKAFYNNKQPDQLSLEVLLDTPNSKTNRKFALNVLGTSKPQKTLTITLASPFKQASFEGLVIDTDNEQALSAKLISDGSEYSFKIGAHVSGDASRKKYEPLLEYKYPEAAKSERAWIGRKGAGNKGGKTQTGLGITGAIFVEKNADSHYRKYEMTAVTLTTPRLKITVDGTVTVDSNLLATDLKASYDKDTVTLNSKIQKLAAGKYIAKIEFQPSQYPDLGGSIKWEYERGPHQVENKLVIVHGPDVNSESNRVSLTQLLKYKYESVKVFDFHTENSVTYPLLAISAYVKGGATPKTVQYDIDITYDKSQVKSKLNAKAGGKHPSDYNIDFEAKALGNSVILSSKHERVAPTKSKFTNSLELKPGGKYQLNALSELSVKPGDFFQSLDAELKLPQDPKVVKLITEAKHNSKEDELEFKLIAANKPVIDFEFELEKKAEPSGKFKLSLPKYIDSQGSFTTTSDKATGSFHLDLLKTGRKIQGNGQLTKTGKHVKGSGEVLWDAKKDPNKKIHVETDTEYSGKSIDSKNTLKVLDYTTNLNVKGSLEGSLADGTLIGDGELTLPCGRVLAAKVNRVVHLGTDDNKIEGTYEILDSASKDAPPRKLVVKIAAKNINPAKVQFDGQVDVTYVTPDKQDVVLHVVGKKIPQGDKWTISGQGSVTGSLVKHPLHTKLSAEVSEQLLKGQLTSDRKYPPAHYDFELKAGNDIVLTSNGKINQDQVNAEVELKLPADLAVTSFKWQTSNTLNLYGPENAEKKIITSNAVHWNGDKFVKFSWEGSQSGSNDQWSGKATWESFKHSARTLTYKAHADEKRQKVDLDLALQWEGKTADVCIKADVASNPIHLSISSNVPEHGKYEIDLSHKESNGGDYKETSVTATGKSKKFAFSSKISKSKPAPYIDLNLEVPQGKSRVYGKWENKGERHITFDSKVNWWSNGGGSLDANGELNLKTVDDIFVKLFIDSPKLNLNKVEFEAANKPPNGITFHGKTADKEISGSLQLTSKGALPNLHYEGSGNLKIGDTSYPVEFKLIDEFDLQKKGIAKTLLDIKAGKYAFTGNSAFTVEENNAGKLFKFEALTKYCNEKGCRSDEIKSTSHKKGPFDYEVTAEAKYDLSTHLILDQPVVFKIHYNKDAWKHDNKLEAVYGAEKLQYHSYIKDDHAGVELTLPKRVIAAEATYEFGKNKKPASYKIEANFWLDKKSAADKTSLLISSDNNKLPDGLSSVSEVRFNTPGLKELALKSDFNVNTKDRVVTGKLEADVFAKKNQKLVVDYKAVAKEDKDTYSATDNLHIHSKGLNLEAQFERKFSVHKKGQSFSYAVTGYYLDSKQAKREGVVKVNVDPKTFNALVKIPEGTLLSADVKVLEKDLKHVHWKGTYNILNLKFEEEVEIKGTHLKGSLVQKNANNPQLDVDVGFTPGEVAELTLKFSKKPFVSLEIALDEAHFLKAKHNYNTDVFKDLAKLAKEDIVDVAKEASKIFKETAAKLSHEVTDKLADGQKALPNFKPAVEHYKKELEQLKEEISSDKAVKDLIDFLKNTFGALFSQIGSIIHELSNTTEQLISLLNEALQKVIQSFKSIIPKLKSSYEQASNIIITKLDEILKHAVNLFEIVLDKIKEHDKEIQELIAIASDAVHDVGKLFAKTFGDIYKEISDFVGVLWDQVQSLPAYNMLKEKLQELKNFKVPEQYWEGYHEVVQNIVGVLPTPELQQFVKTAADYLEKIVKQQPINRPEAIDVLYKELVAAVRSLIAFIEAHKPDDKTPLPSAFVLPTVPSLGLFVAPPGTFRFSLLNWIRSSDLPTLSELYHTYRPRHSPFDIIPPFKATAQLIGGTEFFTFDRKHYSFKGSCSYILSADVIDKNFTLVANMEGGKLKSIAAFDHENSVELQHDNSVLVNGKPSELPVHVGDLNMWRRFSDGTGFATNSGLMFFCTPHLDICAFTVNGFYFGKTRGLLGTYNNEPYDDTIVPAGKLAKSTAEFANSWKVTPQCGDGAVHDQPAPAADQCSKLFSGDSPLRNCFNYENPEPYRAACNRQVAEASGDKQEKACNIAKAYVGYCYYVHFVRTKLPDNCGKCQVGSQTIQIGESAPVKLPQKEADVIFVVEQLDEHEEIFKNLITPLVSTLTNDFKEKGITDVKYALIGYGAHEQRYPSVYTFNGKYNEFSGTAKNIHFDKKHEVTEPKFSDRLEDIKEKIEIELGTSQAAVAYREAFNYPFRSEAFKTVIGVSSGCTKASLPFQSLRFLYYRLNLLNTGIRMNLITPVDDLKIDGKDEKTAANIVGFDSNSVYTQAEAKRKVIKGDEEAFKNLKYDNNLCIDLALGTNGAVFSSTNFVKGKPNIRKNYLQVLSNKITDSVTSEEVREECRCELERGMAVRTRCKITSRVEKDTKKGGVKG